MSAQSTFEFYKNSKDPLFGGASADAIQRYYDDIAGLNEDEIEAKNISLINSGGVGSSYAAQNNLNNYVATLEDQGYTPAEFDLYSQTQLATLNAGFAQERQDSINETNIIVNNLITDSNKYIADIGLQGTVYGQDAETYRSTYRDDTLKDIEFYKADQDRAKFENVEAIRGEYGLDLQAIRNAGAEAVEKIRGEYGLAGDRISASTQKDITEIQRQASDYRADRGVEANMFGAIFSGFWN
tara:strand:+ start:1484 stop:2206 length:723 start_codon:yes stop_codon:yes gene_type:complete